MKDTAQQPCSAKRRVLMVAVFPFPASALKDCYRNHGGYVSQYQQAVQAVVREGFLLKADADALRKAAAQSSVGK